MVQKASDCPPHAEISPNVSETQVEVLVAEGRGQKEGTWYATLTAVIIVIGLFVLMVLNPEDIEIGEPDEGLTTAATQAGAKTSKQMVNADGVGPKKAKRHQYDGLGTNFERACRSPSILSLAKAAVHGVLTQCTGTLSGSASCPVGCKEAWVVYRKEPCSQFARQRAKPLMQRQLMQLELRTMVNCFESECSNDKSRISAGKTINAVLKHCPTGPNQQCTVECKNALIQWHENPCVMTVLIGMRSIPSETKRNFISTRLHAHNFCLGHGDLRRAAANRNQLPISARQKHDRAELENFECKSLYIADKSALALQRVEATCWDKRATSVFKKNEPIPSPTSCLEGCRAALEVLASTPCAFRSLIQAHRQNDHARALSKEILRLVGASTEVCRIEKNLRNGS
jgi:hypothetical protein